MRLKPFTPFLPLVSGALILEASVRFGIVPAYLAPSPSQIVQSLLSDRETYLEATTQTFAASVLGLTASLIIGVILASLFQLSKTLHDAIFPYTLFFQTVPVIAIAPLLVIWFGFGFSTVFAASFIVSLFPVLANAMFGLSQTDRGLIDLFKLYQVGKMKTLLRLRLPAALPQIWEGLKISAGLSIIGSIVGEFIAGGGLGGLIDTARTQQRVDQVFAAVIISSLMGLFFVKMVQLMSRRQRWVKMNILSKMRWLMSFNRVLAGSLVAYFVFALVAPKMAIATKLAKEPLKIRLTLNWKPEPQFGGFYAAREGGHFKSANLNVEIQPGGSGTPTAQMIASGQTEYGIVSADELVMLNSKGAGLVALFAAYQTNPQAIMVHEDRGFKTLADVFASEGTLAMQKGLPYASYLLKKYPKPKVKIVPYAGGIAQFATDKKHSQQCFATSEPLLATKQGLKTKVFLVSESGFNPYTTVLATTRKYLEAHQAEAQAVTLAVRKGWEDYLKDPTHTNKLMGSLNPGMDAETFFASAQAQKSLIETPETKQKGLGVMTEERFTALVDQMADLKLISAKPEVSELFQAF